ncbi:hypothetical protein K505DRAFT_229382 [Melanomma pulvis-pyrius CBS 109.77]|uniref:Btz domain-containing protein n=1 Tax=Melanomma pulvis-pyrius CBS 109.77 TaxID=1314802 RepID=A0A6A6XX06_9PLEO|nr:hypothetical protein K505DRAFT_229382 [Melanomma pulvis-pyrius CBS 109.77]
MAAVRKRVNIGRRRRLDDEGDDMSVATEVADDSQSDISVPSDVDENADADNSDLSDVDSSPSLTGAKSKRKGNGPRDTKPHPEVATRRIPSPPIARSDAIFTPSRDTQMMINGLKISEKAADDEVVDFETESPAVEPAPSVGVLSNRQETFAERKRREHEEYKKKRDADPAFIPNRGAFFMHDQRSHHGQNGFRQFSVRGGARGRGGGGGGGGGGAIGGPFAPANLRAQAVEATDSPWQHDLHETLINTGPQSHTSQPQGAAPSNAPTQLVLHQTTRSNAVPAAKAPPTRNFSTTVHTHNALVRVFLPEMKTPIHFQNVPIKQHTRLPNHRPPLRRDKPVRISLPPSTPRYIFPTVERSFIFIPRALRPNQQGFGRGRGRGFGSFGGGFSSRRTSAYGGSVYSPSVAMSRRSSMAREMGRDGLVSPAGSIMSRPGGFVDPARPVVRLPPGGTKLPNAPPVFSPTGQYPPQSYPLPQKPTFRENWQGQLPMHQPRPQKTVSVAGIESPASMTFNPPQQQEQQPFHQQVPAHMNGNAPQSDQPPFYPHARQLSYPSQASTGTPLSNIPERAIHAPAFQPFQQQPNFQPPGFGMSQGFYYPQNGAQPQFLPPGGMVPMFVPNAQQGGYVMPMAPPPVPAAPAPAGQNNMVAYESNGMTYYVDPAQLPAPVYAGPPVESYPQASYAVPGMGGMMTPSPEGAYYYPQQLQPTAGVFYQS